MTECNNAINNTIGATVSGVTNLLTITNPSNTASSAARISTSVGGGTAANPSFNLNVNGVKDFEMGIDNNDSDSLVIANTTTLGTGNVCKMTTGVTRTLPLQPRFFAYASASVANVTGDATTYTIIYDTEVEDQGGNYDNTTVIFTVPEAGVYQLSASISLDNLTVSHNSQIGSFLCTGSLACAFVEGIRFVECNPGADMSNTFTWNQTGSVDVPLQSGDTVEVSTRVGGSTKTVGVYSPANTGLCWFSAYLLG
jgi:hypothetical protein